MIRRFRAISMQKGLNATLALQAVVALLLLVSTLGGAVAPTLKDSKDFPAGPITPGDQRRLYREDPTDLRYVTPGTPVLPQQTEMPPERLEVTSQTIDGLGEVVLLNGEIAAGDFLRVRNAFADMARKPDIVALNSPGGLVSEAIKIGEFIRQEELQSGVLSGSYCLSSCPYILAGGVERIVSRKGAVGLHQHYYEAPRYLPVFLAVEGIQAGQGATMAYLIEMGIDPSLMLYSLRTPPDEIYIMVDEELSETELATSLVD